MGSLVSLVMTDIVDSTRRWAADDVGMAADLERHDGLLREVVGSAGGRVFKHTGDGMIAVFDDPAAAVGAAAGIQRAVSTATWQHPDGLHLRAAVHSGVVYERDGDMFGTAVNKLARILGVCPPGAVLVSSALAGLLVERAPEGLGVRPVGEVTLAGFTEPELVHAVDGGGAATVVAVGERVGVDRRGTGLPSVDDELIGRHDELTAIWGALGRTRLVTLVGVGGMGKTRLALEVAVGALETYDGGVWWIDLSAATTTDAVVAVACAAVGAQETPGRSRLQVFCDRFATKEALIVVDNCEHVVAGAIELIDAVRSGAPKARVVATSREALGIRGEHIVPIGSLPTSEGMALFEERALAIRPDLDAAASRSAIEAICRRLDGIPLAIELAAARCMSMEPREIAARLDDRFRLLRGGRSSAERHRTLQGAVAWSYEMLDERERHVFHRLAVFSDGSLIDGLMAVCEMDEFDALEVIQRLVARSMVVPSRTPLGTRYHQLETLRQYAEDRMVAEGTIDEVRHRHLGWVQQLALDVVGLRGTRRHIDGFRRVRAEYDNVRAAVQFAVVSGRHHIAHTVVSALGSYDGGGMYDWVRPIQLEAGWTREAAICCEAGAFWDLGRGLRSMHVDQVPQEVLFAVPEAGSFFLLRSSFEPGGWRLALPLVESIEPTADLDRLNIDTFWLTLQTLRQTFGGEGSELDDAEFDRLRLRGRRALEVSRRIGDDLMRVELLTFFGQALEGRSPDEALPYLREAVEIGQRLGEPGLGNRALAAQYRCLAAIAARDGAHDAASAQALRDAIVTAVDDGLLSDAYLLAQSSYGVIGPFDPDVVLTLAAVRQRETGVVANDEFERYGFSSSLSAEEWQRRTAGVSMGEALDMVLAALDRVIAVAHAEAAVGGDG